MTDADIKAKWGLTDEAWSERTFSVAMASASCRWGLSLLRQAGEAGED